MKQKSVHGEPEEHLFKFASLVIHIYIKKIIFNGKNELNSKRKLTTSELYIRRSLVSDIGGLTISPMYSIICRSKPKFRNISSAQIDANEN